MLMTKKVKEETKSDWAVILERPREESSKKKVIQAVASSFPLNPQEVKDLVESTPIVLLDELSFGIAERIKEHFKGQLILCSVTNDTYTKRKCFRAVWPEPPDLTVFVSQSPVIKKQPEPLPPVSPAAETV